MIKILSIFGTRPEAIKMAPVVRRLAQTNGVASRVCVTAQHRQMLDQVLGLFEIEPDYDLDIMREDQLPAETSTAIFRRLDPVLSDFRPNWVLVQGDTTTAAIAALLAYYRRARVGHVEAGLRTGDKWQPFPEEINRRVVGVTADLHFAPTEWARRNLLQEGIPDDTIVVTGNPGIDALQYAASQPYSDKINCMLRSLKIGNPTSGPKLVLATAHRRENFGRPLENICSALRALAARGDTEIIFPVHPNPNVRVTVERLLKGHAHITLLPPLDFLPLVQLMQRTVVILTDSGGIQEEATALGVPTLVLREKTERPEGVAAGALKLVGTQSRRIVKEAARLLEDPQTSAGMEKAANPFGDGRAAERIVAAVQSWNDD